MQQRIRDQLRQVCLRQKLMGALSAASMWLSMAILLSLPLVLLQRGAVISSLFVVPIACAVATLVGAVIGVVRSGNLRQAALQVDTHYRLKDRVASALAFETKSTLSDLERIQIEQTARHLRSISAKNVVPFDVPQPTKFAVCGLFLLSLLWFLPLGSGQTREPSVPRLPAIQGEAQRLRSVILPKLRRLAADEHLPARERRQIEQLEQGVDTLLREVASSSNDRREALAGLSRMQQIITAARRQFEMDATAARLTKIGQALADADATRPLSQALQEQEFARAAEELETVQLEDLDQQESSTLAENLARMRETEPKTMPSPFQEATKELADGLTNRDAEAFAAGTKQLAELSRQQQLREDIARALRNQIVELSEAKTTVQNATASDNAGQAANVDGGNNTAKTNRESSNWGEGVTGQPQGEELRSPQSESADTTIAGVRGAGPVQRKMVVTSDDSAVATREYREKYREFKRASEQVLETEALPLGYRKMIRRYFESIRPKMLDKSAEDDDPALTPRTP